MKINAFAGPNQIEEDMLAFNRVMGESICSPFLHVAVPFW